MRRLHLRAGPGRELASPPADVQRALDAVADARVADEDTASWLQAVVAAAPALGVTIATLEAEPASVELATAAAGAGFTLVRTTLQLRRSLPLEAARADVGAAEGSAFRAFRPGHDEQAWVEVNNRAFAWHPDQSGWTVADLRRKEALAWFRPDGFLVHDDDEGVMDGFCWTKIHGDTDPPLGEIFVIGVDPAAHGRGLGRALVVAGLAWLAGQGLDQAMLYVEADNAPALHLYRDLGFTEHQARRWWERTYPA